jgi:indole-3-glycerol phosphate synthase
VSDFLRSMARDSARRAAAARGRESEAALRRRASDTPPPRPLSLHAAGFDLIAEIKRRAPSTGPVVGADAPDFVQRQSTAYVRAGATAVSVLTEPEAFAGALSDLEEAARAVPVPVLRKDFLVEPYQLFEARAAGAGGVLLIIRLLEEARLREMLDAAAETRQFVLLEAFDEEDLARAATLTPTRRDEAAPLLVGLNTRDLTTLEVDSRRLADLRERFPPGAPRVAESGLTTVEDARAVARLGYDAALVGGALMRATDPARLAAGMIAAGRDERAKAWASG